MFLQLYSVDQKSLALEKELSDFLDSLQENLSWPDTVITTKNSVKDTLGNEYWLYKK